jgi:hypothetical protein
MTWDYTLAENGNVALTAEIDLESGKGEILLALGLGRGLFITYVLQGDHQ